MVYHMPDGSRSEVTSICEKQFLSLTGDGRSSIGQLILENDRAVLQYEKLRRRFGHIWDTIPAAGEYLLLEPIGNHCQGTMFLDRNNEIDERIKENMIRLLRTMPEVYYGRFDMRVASWESLRNSQDIKVLEFNGASSDPAHIYQPGFSLWKAYKVLAWHWDIMYRIARQNKRLGHRAPAVKDMISALIFYFRYKRTN